MSGEFLQGGFRKVTGPIEHWLTTFHTGYWGFRPDKEEAWRGIEEGEVFLFHASRSEFLDVAPKRVKDAGSGVIGIGRVGAKSIKDEPAWWEEIHSDGNYPFLIHFSEIHWFGDMDAIRDAPVADKSLDEMVEDVHALDENKISFGEMTERAGYRIPAQGSPGNVKQPEKLFPLLVERIRGIEPESRKVPEDETSNLETSTGVSIVRSRSRDRNLDGDRDTDQTVTYETSVEQTMDGWMEHEHSLDTFEDVLVDAGFETGETDHSDILAWRDGDIVLGEAKFVHDGNERDQIRKAVGQLHEYSYFDIAQHEDRASKSLTKCLVLTQEPSDEYREFLASLQNEGILTFWTDEYDIQGLPESEERLEELVA